MNDVFILTLLNLTSISRKTINYIFKVVDPSLFNVEKIEELLWEARNKTKRINAPTINEIEIARDKAESIIKLSEEEGINNITILDSDFPNKLKSIDDPPVLLFYKGNKKCITEDKSVTVIGTRTPTQVGQEIAQKLGYIFGKDGFVVTSGLAKGCDELAHKGCIDANARSIAVLPGGLDKIYPASNKNLANLILKNNGCLVSEYTIGTRPFKGSFVDRDRLESAFSEAVIVVETDIVGGTMHTVGYTLKQNRILACYNHPQEFLFNNQTRGNQKLIMEKKAIGIYSKNDIEHLKLLILNIMEKKRIERELKDKSSNLAVQLKIL